MWFLLLVLVLLPSLPLAEPIDSRQYGFLKTSMTMDAVRERFGAPDQPWRRSPGRQRHGHQRHGERPEQRDHVLL